MNRTTALLAAGALLLAPAFSFAASIQLTPATVSTVAGQTFTVSVVAIPSGAPLYTASANLSFNANVLEVTNFSFAPTWVQLTQSGYDSIDNTGGILIETGGYPNGFTAATTLGTVTFEAKEAGTATIAVTGSSVLLDGGSSNEISGAQGSVAITVANAPATQNAAQVPATSNNVATPAAANTATTTTATTTTNVGQTAAAAAAIGTSSQTAAVGTLFNGVPQWIWWVILAIIVLGGGYWIWRRYSATNA